MVSIMDLRYHMNDILKALERNEEVQILSRGQVKGVLRAPHVAEPSKKSISQDAFFAMYTSEKTVEEQMKALRGRG